MGTRDISALTTPLVIGSGSDFMQIETDGSLKLNGDATQWTDLRTAPISAKVAGGKQPTWAQFTDDGSGSTGVYSYAFSASAENEFWTTLQMPHGWKLGSDIEPHIHWAPMTTDTGTVRWGIEYVWSNIDGTYGNSTIAYAEDAADGTALKHQLADFAAVSGTGKTLSSVLLVRLFRDAVHGNDTFTGTAMILEFDIHYEVDAFGSNSEYVK